MTAAILEIRRDVRLAAVRPNDDVTPIRVRPAVIGRSANAERHPICRWRRDAKGQLACAWEPDIGLRLERLITANTNRRRLPKFGERARRTAQPRSAYSLLPEIANVRRNRNLLACDRRAHRLYRRA